MNFQGKRDFSEDKQRYREIVLYLLGIQARYPDLYLELAKAPQLENDVEPCRRRKRYARRFFRGLVNLVKQDRQKMKPLTEVTKELKLSTYDFAQGHSGAKL